MLMGRQVLTGSRGCAVRYILRNQLNDRLSRAIRSAVQLETSPLCLSCRTEGFFTDDLLGEGKEGVRSESKLPPAVLRFNS
jgi:hypothetical protein